MIGIILMILVSWMFIGLVVSTLMMKHDTKDHEHLDSDDIKAWVLVTIFWPVGIWCFIEDAQIPNPFYKKSKTPEDE